MNYPAADVDATVRPKREAQVASEAAQHATEYPMVCLQTESESLSARAKISGGAIFPLTPASLVFTIQSCETTAAEYFFKRNVLDFSELYISALLCLLGRMRRVPPRLRPDPRQPGVDNPAAPTVPTPQRKVTVVVTADFNSLQLRALSKGSACATDSQSLSITS